MKQLLGVSMLLPLGIGAVIIGIGLLVVLVIGLTWLFQGSEDQAVRVLVAEVQAAALAGLNRRSANALDEYFASVEEGAQAAGLAQTQQAYKEFVAQLSSSDAVQFHSFDDIQAVEVHESARLAKVTYRLHFSVLRNGQVIYGAKAIEDLALLKTPRGWRISGGDAAQLEDVIGTWPPR
jgi:hypothetical protein